MTKLRSGRRTATSGGGGAGAASNGATKKKQQANKKRSADDFEEDSKILKKAKPSINKAAEELVCPILQGLPIDPVIAEDVSAIFFSTAILISSHFFLFAYCLVSMAHCLTSVPCDKSQGQIYERKEIEKYLEEKKDEDEILSPVTKKPLETKVLIPSVHIRNNIEHLIESGIIEGEMADTWKERMAERREAEENVRGWKEGAEKGDTDAMFELGVCYERGEYGFKEDSKEAFKWYKKGSDACNVCCMSAAGACLMYGVGTAANVSEGLVLITLAPEKGSDHACFSLAQCYYRGLHGIRKDIEKAKFWLEKVVAGDCEYDHLDDACAEQARVWIAKCNNRLKT